MAAGAMARCPKRFLRATAVPCFLCVDVSSNLKDVGKTGIFYDSPKTAWRRVVLNVLAGVYVRVSIAKNGIHSPFPRYDVLGEAVHSRPDFA